MGIGTRGGLVGLITMLYRSMKALLGNCPAKTSGWRDCFRLGSNEVARHKGRQCAALRCVGVTHHDLPNQNLGYLGSRPSAAS